MKSEAELAINEACAVWIEQRIQEELEGGSKSMAAIGRELSAEVEKIFEAKISPNTLRMKVSRAVTRTNVQGDEIPTPATVEPGVSGVKMDVEDLIQMVAEFVDSKKGSIRDGCAAVAAKAGRKAASVRTIYMRALKKSQERSEATEAWHFVDIAIIQLERIRKNDPCREKELKRLILWASAQLEG